MKKPSRNWDLNRLQHERAWINFRNLFSVLIYLLLSEATVSIVRAFFNLSPFLNRGITFAVFHIEGNVLVWRDKLNKAVREGVITSTASFKRRALILSRPTALLVFNELMDLETKSSLIGWNVKVEWQAVALAMYGSETIFSAIHPKIVPSNLGILAEQVQIYIPFTGKYRITKGYIIHTYRCGLNGT